MAYYYKIDDSDDALPLYKGFHLQKVTKCKISGPKINYDFSKHVLVELLDDTTPELKLWNELGLTNNKNIIHKRMMIDSHRIKCRRAVVICIDSDEAKQLAQSLSQMKVMNRCVCAVVIEDLLSDLCLFEKQLIQCGDMRPQEQLLYVSDLSRSRGPMGLAKFLKEKFSPFGTILSVLVCSDDDDYAFPEGVIRFAYLSEAFAAELAFDQLVVGKERLSVTAHHNILLSQCDLRVRLRDAQWCCNMDSNTSFSSSFQSYNQTYELNDLGTHDDDPVVNSMNNLQISHINNIKIVENNDLEDSLPAFSQFNLNVNLSKQDSVKDASYSKNKSTERVENILDPLSEHKISVSNSKICDIKNSVTSDSVDYLNQEKEKLSSKTVPFEMTSTKIIEQLNSSQNSVLKPLNHEKSLGIKKSFKNTSNSDRFSTNNNYSNSNLLLLSSKHTICESSHSYENNTISDYQSTSTDYKYISSSTNIILNDSEVSGKVGKTAKKRRKKFTPSQKLCLKSQRTGLSQNSVQSVKSEISISSSSQSDKPVKNSKSSRRDLNLSIQHQKVVPPDSSGTSRTADWILQLPQAHSQISQYPSEKTEIMLVGDTFERPSGIKKCHKSRISIYQTPSLKSNVLFIPEQEIFNSDNSSLENVDPNEMPPVITAENSFAILPDFDKFKSPLQMWLKQELMNSTNNSVIKSLETSKSIIVCAARTKDVIISVGCSHMTCDSCYPESTDLLLGYN